MKTTQNITSPVFATAAVIAILALASAPSVLPSASPDAAVIQPFPTTARLPIVPALTFNEYLEAQYRVVYDLPTQAVSPEDLQMVFGIAIAEYTGGSALKLNRVLFAALEDANFDNCFRRNVPTDSLLLAQSAHTVIGSLPVGSAQKSFEMSEPNTLSYYLSEDHLTGWTNPDDQDQLDTLGMMVALFAHWNCDVVVAVMAHAYRYSHHPDHATQIVAFQGAVEKEFAAHFAKQDST